MRIRQTLSNIFNSLQNCEAATIQLCRLLNVNVTDSAIQNKLEEHPDYPSLLAISDVLNSYGVSNTSIKVRLTQLKAFSFPILTQLEIDNEKYFAALSQISDYEISYIDPIHNNAKRIPLSEFEKSFTGYVLLPEIGKFSGESEYRIHRKREDGQLAIKTLTPIFLPLIFIISVFYVLQNVGSIAIIAILYALLSLVGSIICALLLLYEIDKNNPTLQKICIAGKKVNCSAVITSKESKIFGISWSSIGFSYFTGIFLTLLYSGIYSLPHLYLLAWLNAIALPYIVFSIYYQANIVKKWCMLCLCIQGILILQFVTAYLGNFYSRSNIVLFQIPNLITIIISFTIPFLGTIFLLPAIRTIKKNKKSINELKKLKNNPSVFKALLSSQRVIEAPSASLGITLGNPSAKNILVKVCNPYCGPCSTAHPSIGLLLENNSELKVQIIYTSSNDESDRGVIPIRHLLAIAEKQDATKTQEALDDWYSQRKKDYDFFAKKYPVNEELGLQTERIIAMRDWCKNTGITYTPTYFINGRQLPEQYNVADLNYFLSD